jgi:adenylosuccinate lyase
MDNSLPADTEIMSNIDKLTLELLINKTQYSKYIKKTNPKKFLEQQNYLGKIAKYKKKLENLSEKCLIMKT